MEKPEDSTMESTVQVVNVETPPGAQSEPLLRWFGFIPLPYPFQETSRRFAELAEFLVTMPPSAERTVALRKLLESRDAAHRATI